MAAPIVQVSTDAMAQLANGFVQASNEAQMWKQRLQSEVDDLRNGAWGGDGARAFYSEYDEIVAATLDKMMTSLEDISNLVKSATDVLTETETTIANNFKSLMEQLVEIS
jgi:WXG100 family type VII secretion target